MESSTSIPYDWLRFALAQQHRRDRHCWVTGSIERHGMIMYDLFLEVLVVVDAVDNFEYVDL